MSPVELNSIIAQIGGASGRPVNKSQNAIAVFYSGVEKGISAHTGLDSLIKNRLLAEACGEKPDFYTIKDTQAGRVAEQLTRG